MWGFNVTDNCQLTAGGLLDSGGTGGAPDERDLPR